MANIVKNNPDFKFTDVKIFVNVKGTKSEITIGYLETLLEDGMIASGITERLEPKPYKLKVNGRILTQSGDLSLFAQNLNYFINHSIYCKPDTVFTAVCDMGAVTLVHQK